MARRGSSRRTFIAGAAAATTAGALSAAGTGTARAAAAPDPAAAPAPGGRREVAVLGGGVAGLTAAHELAERGYAVTVYERRALGGKARSMDVPGSARGGRRPRRPNTASASSPAFTTTSPTPSGASPSPATPTGSGTTSSPRAR